MVASPLIDDFSSIHPLVLPFIKPFCVLLLYVPSYLSALLYIGEKDAPPSLTFWQVTAYGLLVFTAFFGLTVAIGFAKLSPSCRLIEPVAIYLVTVIGALCAPKESAISDLTHDIPAVFFLGLFVPALELAIWNTMLIQQLRVDHVVDLEYLTGVSSKILNFRRSMTGLDTIGDPSDPSSSRVKPANEAV